MLERAGASQSGDATAMDLAAGFSLHELAAHAQRFAEIDFNIKHSPFPQLPLEIAIVSATTSPGTTAGSPDRRPAEQAPGRPTPRVRSSRASTGRDSASAASHIVAGPRAKPRNLP